MEIPSGYAQANLKFTGSAAPTGAEITIGLDVSLYGTTPTDLAQDIAEGWNTAGIDALVVDGIALTQVLVKFGPQATGPSGLWTGNIGGTVSQDGSAPMVALLVHKVTALGGRAGRGRFYHPGLSEQVVDESGVVGDTTLGNWLTALDTFHGILVAVDAPPVVLHSDGSPISTPTPVTAFLPTEQVGTQRRRNRR